MKLFIYLTLSLFLAACASAQNTQTIQIYKLDGARQCEGEGFSVAAMQAELVGIRVHATEKSHLPDVMFPAVCGGGTGSINVYTIDAQQRRQAEQRGFALLPAAATP